MVCLVATTASPYETLHADVTTSSIDQCHTLVEPDHADVDVPALPPCVVRSSTQSNAVDRVNSDCAADSADDDVPRCMPRPNAAGPVESTTLDQISDEIDPDLADADARDPSRASSVAADDTCAAESPGSSVDDVEPWESASRPGDGYTPAPSSEVVNKPRRDTPAPSRTKVANGSHSAVDAAGPSKPRSVVWKDESAAGQLNAEVAGTTVPRTTQSVSEVPYCDEVDPGPGAVGLSDSAPSLSRPQSNDNDPDPSSLKRSQSDVLP